MEELTAYLRDNLDGRTDIEECMRVAVRSHVRFHLDRQKETFIANSELRGLTPEHYQQIVRKRDEYEQIFQRIIREGIAAGVFAAADDKILSYAILTLCNGGAIWFKPRGRMSMDAIAEIYENFVLRGLRVGHLAAAAAVPDRQAALQ
jgi:AcrR family transcriptional regulator